MCSFVLVGAWGREENSVGKDGRRCGDAKRKIGVQAGQELPGTGDQRS